MRLHSSAIRLGTSAAMLATAATAAAGQQVCGDSASAPADSGAIPVVVIARVHADAIVFESDPDVRVTLNGCDPLPGQMRVTSTLPDTIQPGVRYTNVEVTAEYRAWLTIECRAPEDVVENVCAELGGRD